MEGWIKIHRQIKDHWIWDDPHYFKAWIGILLTVNHEDKKILIQGELIECKRGQSILSLAGWVKWLGKKWTMQRIRTFFELLKRDQMITVEGLRKTTRLTVCKYDNYQFEQQAKNKQRTSRQHPDNILTTTNKNEEEIIKNEKKEEPNKSADFLDQILYCFIQEHGSYEILNRGKERSAISKILSEYKKKYPAATSEETLEGLKEYFKRCVNIPDVWLMNNMSPSIIVSKFNEINKILRNGTNKKISGATDEQFAAFYAKEYGSDSIK